MIDGGTQSARFGRSCRFCVWRWEVGDVNSEEVRQIVSPRDFREIREARGASGMSDWTALIPTRRVWVVPVPGGERIRVFLFRCVQDGSPEWWGDCGCTCPRQGVGGGGADCEVSETARIRAMVESAHQELLVVFKPLLVTVKENRRWLGELAGELNAECRDCRRSSEVSFGVKVEWSGGEWSGVEWRGEAEAGVAQWCRWGDRRWRLGHCHWPRVGRRGWA
jgi:hypothetical protein